MQKGQVIFSTANNLEAAQEKIKKLEKKAAPSSTTSNIQTQVLNRLSDALENWNFKQINSSTSSRSTFIPDSAVFHGDKSKFPTWKEGILMKLNSDADHYPTDQNNQTNKPFSSWIAEIRRDAEIAGYENTQALRDIVFLNISFELQRALINENDVHFLEFDQAIARLQDIDNRQRRFADVSANYRSRRIGKSLSSPESRLESFSSGIVLLVSQVCGETWKQTGHLVLDCLTENRNSKDINSLALVDSDASAHGFVDTRFAHTHDLDLISLDTPRTLQVFDGSEPVSGQIYHLAKTTLKIAGHTEVIYLYVTPLANFDLVLGLPWLRLHNSRVNWAEESITFDNASCKDHSEHFPVIEKAISEIQVRKRKEDTKLMLPKRTFQAKGCDAKPFEESSSGKICRIMAVTIEDIKEAVKEKPRVDPSEELPKVYHEYLQVFSKDDADKLPPHRPSDHQIILQPGTEPPWGPPYGMSREELLVLKKYIQENLEKGLIRPSASPASSLVLFVKKSGGGLRFCVDYRALNDITVKN
ncbi:hypothetical protein K3495_g12422 [Podosphaera aphanis]|nr:hypothetical protein K3495_g12422 [Podosphaera aphanis]